jgi:hypothetical protein
MSGEFILDDDVDNRSNQQPDIPQHSAHQHQGQDVAVQQRSRRDRARVACRRCRRLRIKCTHEDGKTPCVGCQKAGGAIAQECTFPARGLAGPDRNYRAKASRDDAHIIHGQPRDSSHSLPELSSRTSASPSPAILPVVHKSPTVNDRWGLLPPPDEVVEACKVLVAHFFQLGFLPRALFLERLSKDPQSINVFFLLSILSVSARFTPSLIRRYGDGLKAAEVFMDRAVGLVSEEMYFPTIERTQAFFLLAISEWGKGDKTSSNIHMGIAVRMAGMLRLHREETYELSNDASAEDVINSEMARRTFWMLESQDNLHSGFTSPVSFSLSDITTLLPCDESDFAFGTISADRAALAGTLIATRNPALVHKSTRSLFATLIQAHNLWGQIARRAVSNDYSSASSKPWDTRSDYATLLVALSQWEEHLPSRHRWSIWNLRGFKNEDLDLAYLSITMVVRLSNIVLRRNFLETIIYGPRNDGSPNGFWMNMSTELFQNVLGLNEQIVAFFSLRSREQGYPAMIVFCVYVCGSLGNHLWKHPEICPNLATHAEDIVSKSLEVLIDLQHAWPLARRWRKALQQTASKTRFGLIATPPNTVDQGSFAAPENMSNTFTTADYHVELGLDEPPLDGPIRATIFDLAETAGQMSQISTFPSEPTGPTSSFSVYHNQTNLGNEFDTELTAFLEAEGQLGFLYDWDRQIS